MRLAWLDPIGTDAWRDPTLAVLRPLCAPETEVTFSSLPPGRPLDLEDPADEDAVRDDVVAFCRAAGPSCAGILVGCFFDTAVVEARRVVPPGCLVLGPCEATTAVAARARLPFTVLVGHESWASRVQARVERCGHGEWLASIRPAGVSVAELGDPTSAVLAALIEAGRRALEEDGARQLIVGCTADLSSTEHLAAELGVPVLDAVRVPFLELQRRCRERVGP